MTGRAAGVSSVRPTRVITLRGFAALCVPALLAAAAIGHATGNTDGGPALVTVEARGERTATGFVVRPGRVVTVAHAVGTGLVTVRGADGVARQATVLHRDNALDLAVLLAPGLDGATPAGVSSGRLPLTRDAMHVVVRRGGTQVELPARVRRRIDATVRAGDGRVIARRPALELAARIRSGDSGAPVVAPDGRVTGVVFARSRERSAVAYAVDAAVLERLLR
jgi:S1-C subfamily serine protease